MMVYLTNLKVIGIKSQVISYKPPNSSSKLSGVCLIRENWTLCQSHLMPYFTHPSFSLPKLHIQGAKKIIFTACHSGKLKLAFTSPDFISASPKSFSSSRINFTLLLLFEFPKEHHLPVGKLKTDFTSLIAKSTSPGLLDTTFFARWHRRTCTPSLKTII